MNLKDIEQKYGVLTQDQHSGVVYGPDNNLEVLGVLPRHSYDHPPYYVVKCAECSKDSELFGEGLFLSNIKTSIKYQYNPCGCKPQYKYSKDQHEILIKRKATAEGVEFIRWVEPLPKGHFYKNAKIVISNGDCLETYTLRQFYSRSLDPNELSIRNNTNKTYINMVYDKHTNQPIAIKYGITQNPLDRLGSQRKNSIHAVELYGVWQHSSYQNAMICEGLCRQLLGTRFLKSTEFSDGFTETLPSSQLFNVIEIYESNGGVRLEISE